MIYKDMLMQGLILLAPILALSVIAAVAANYAQFGLLFTTKTLAVKLNKINPIEGAKKRFSQCTLSSIL